MNRLKIFIVDDHAILRMGLTSLINAEKDLTVVGDAEDGESALPKIGSTPKLVENRLSGRVEVVSAA